MKTPKPQVDKTAAYMNKGIKNNDAQNSPKGNSFNATLTSQAPDPGLGMKQHKKSISKTGDRFGVPHEHLNPTASTFHKIGRGR